MTKKFLISVADVYAYDSNDNIIFIGKTLLDTNIATTLSNTDIRGGRGAQLEYIYWHSAVMKITITDTQWNLDFLAATVGSSVNTNNNVYTEETVTLAAPNTATILGTPVADVGTTIYGWVTLPGGTVVKGTFAGSVISFTGGSTGQNVCVRYFADNAASRSLTIPANIVPDIVRLVLQAELASSDVAGSNIIGNVQVIVPKATLTGAFTITLKTDGVSTTPVEAQALASEDLSTAACTSVPIYAQIIEVVNGINWYDNVIALAVVGGDFGITTLTSPKTLDIRAIPSVGAAFKPPYADLTFEPHTGDPYMNVGQHTGIVTWASAGVTHISVEITAKTAVNVEVIGTAT